MHSSYLSQGHSRVMWKILSGCLVGRLICVTANSCTVLLMAFAMNLPERKSSPNLCVLSSPYCSLQNEQLDRYFSGTLHPDGLLCHHCHISPSKEHPGLISFRMDWLDLAVQGTLKSQDKRPLINFLHSKEI